MWSHTPLLHLPGCKGKGEANGGRKDKQKSTGFSSLIACAEALKWISGDA